MKGAGMKAFGVLLGFACMLAAAPAVAGTIYRCDSGDGVHPSDAGYAAIARAIDLNLLK